MTRDADESQATTALSGVGVGVGVVRVSAGVIGTVVGWFGLLLLAGIVMMFWAFMAMGPFLYAPPWSYDLAWWLTTLGLAAAAMPMFGFSVAMTAGLAMLFAIAVTARPRRAVGATAAATGLAIAMAGTTLPLRAASFATLDQRLPSVDRNAHLDFLTRLYATGPSMLVLLFVSLAIVVLACRFAPGVRLPAEAPDGLRSLLRPARLRLDTVNIGVPLDQQEWSS